MKQLIHNTETNHNSRIFQNGYKVDGKQGTVKSPLVLLNVIDDTPLPTFDTATQYVISSYVVDVANLKYQLEYTIVDKTTEEIEAETNSKLDWIGLRRDLNQSAFYPLALTQGNPNYFSVLMTTLAKEDYRWVDDLNFIMSAMCQQLFTGGFLTQPDIDALNLILSNNSVPFQVSVS